MGNPIPTLVSPFGEFSLERIPHDPTQTLRAWDAADEYALAYFHEHCSAVQHPLILNDNFGALGVSLHNRLPTLVSDSYVSQTALLANLERNRLNTTVKQLDSLSPLPHGEVVVMKLPKTAKYFEYQLQMLNYYLPEGTPVIVGGMVKYLSSAFIKLADQYLEGFHTSLARKKARLILGKTSKENCEKPRQIEPLELSEYGLSLFNTPNVFSSGKLDIGSRFFLNNYPDLSSVQDIIDVGCGNGVLGLMALKQFAHAKVTFVDESHHAVYSAKQAASSLLGDECNERAQFSVNHCLQDVKRASADAVLCNPPFHQQQAVGIQIARQMFRDSAYALRQEGVLNVIGNRHLGYHIELKKYFKRVDTIASDSKFVMLAAHR